MTDDVFAVTDHKVVKGLRRHELARLTCSNLETVGYYEKIGLLPEPPRSANGYRVYDETHVRRFRFVLRGRDLGFSIEEVRSLLRLVDGGGYTCAEVNDIAVSHLRGIQSKIADLNKLALILDNMTSQCSKGQMPECPIIDTLSVDG